MDPSRPSRTPQPQATPFVAGAVNRPQRSVPPISLPSQPSTSSFGSATPNDKLTPSSVNDSPSTTALVRDTSRVQFNIQDTPLPSMSSGEPFRRKKSLVRPERAPNDPSHPLYNYRTHAARLEADGHGYVGLSTTGAHPSNAYDANPHPNLRRGKSILAREEGLGNETALNFLRRGATLRRNRPAAVKPTPQAKSKPPVGIWMIYCYILTCCCPSPMLRCFGLSTDERQRAWREKIGLLGVICSLMAAVGFLTFGFTQAVCGTPPTNFHWYDIQAGSMVYHGHDYSMDQFAHPAASGVEGGSNPLYSDWNAGGKDGSFLFQSTNKCKSIITPAAGTGIPTTSGALNWYFPCNLHSTDGSGSKNITGYTEGTLCHNVISTANSEFNTATAGTRTIGMKLEGPVIYTWDEVANSTRNLGVYETSVLDFNLLSWLDTSQVSYPDIFTQLMNKNTTWQGKDSTMQILRSNQREVAECLADIVRVGFVEGDTIGCIIADIVLYVSLVFIVGIVAIRFALAVLFNWVYSWRLGSFGSNESYESRRKRAAEIEAWSEDIYRPAPARYRPTTYSAPGGKKSKLGLPNKSRFTYTPQKSVTALAAANNTRPVSFLAANNERKSSAHARSATAGSIGLKTSRSQSSLQAPTFSLGGDHGSQRSSMSFDSGNMASSVYSSGCPYPLANVVPQPPSSYEPFNFPLAHTILLVTAYSESIEGLRTTLDSIATTDYPNSHKLILVIADGMVKGSGNDLTTPEIVLSMMKEDLIPRDEVEANSYVAIADGHKKHNMAKVYAGFYNYDDQTIERSRQQRVPMILVEKTGNPLEAHDAKPGNRGKRDSQVLLMSFLQKVMFDERMTLFEFNFFNAIWRITGISADRFETVLMIDADTKAFPDSVSRMMACMVRDPEIMGLCGETKIANKSETWVTMIQVFEYFVSHHQTKAFESMFGGVSCLPGCFSMYRIKAPKGDDGYWVPILANPDIVEHYSESVVDTLHKKNLLLLGEDRFLTTLMLRTFPRRKMMFCPQAVCKTMVPDTLKVLMSQRRRWINSTIHNLFELLLVRGLCGTFCFSMQFVLFVELIGTLVLPAAISFTLYIIVIAIIPSETTPTVSLILLAFVLGLPGLLIVITARNITYVLWMLIYLLSLPIWNALLPTYAYFHMDDFSWGATRKVEGDKGGGHDDKSGEFDSNNIVMKRWAEFERERRWKSGTHSRESVYYGGASDVFVRTDSPRPAELRRSSINSTSESTIQDPFNHNGSTASHYVPSADNASNVGSHRRAETLPLLELPAPLSRTSHGGTTSSTPQSPNNFSSAEGSPVDLNRWNAQQYSTSGSEIGYAYSTVPKDENLSGSGPLAQYNQSPVHYSPQDMPQALSSSDYMRYQPVDNEADDIDLEPTNQESARTREMWNNEGSLDQFADTTEEESSSNRDHRSKAARSRDPSVGASISSRYGGVSLVDDGPLSGSSNVNRRSRKSSTGFANAQQPQRNSKLLERTRSVDTEESHTQYSDSNLHDSSNNPYSEGSLPPGARR